VSSAGLSTLMHLLVQRLGLPRCLATEIIELLREEEFRGLIGVGVIFFVFFTLLGI